MKRMLLGLMWLVTATAACAEWTGAGATFKSILYVDLATIRRNGNFVKMWELGDCKAEQTSRSRARESYLSEKSQSEYDCDEERVRLLGFSWFDGKMGSGNVVYTDSDTGDKWRPVQPGSIGEALWKIACGKQ